mmetsp:Transcript_12933/g.15680  ORF Transcript_12933/g.15680 Transcript_12933/m.15680 type:complete len:649 (-) Transcript_12933:257-2203(-)|eukprot:CAMPEP_0184008734 /NCGR_PEP_ID=MMETSP0954-20121128/2158_1 /TAXON_ID=627963 /ORGANISM="Aplanochytrium sp, Strain PBS07" /LENGTH=648 /DNA_ID=CAMNT_0026287917 /DNA_START=98 /DNA_END=2044 /DNA_ORIENTATION=-
MTQDGVAEPNNDPNATLSQPVCWSRAPVQGKSEIPQIKNHTATLVGSKVYFFGGYDGLENHQHMHVLDCTTYEWERLRNVRGHFNEKTRKTEFPAGRNGHTCTLAEGQLWIIGGWLGQGPLAAKDMWIFDIARSQWTQPETYGESPGPCNMHTTEYIKHLGELFVFRGGDGREYMNDLHSFNIKTYVWTPLVPTGRLPLKRANQASCVVDDKMFIFGGWDGQKRLNDIHVLDTSVSPPHWSSPVSDGQPPSPRAGMTLTNVRGKIYLFGGSAPQNKCYDDLQVYDPVENAWLKTASVDEDDRTGSGGSSPGGETEINKERERIAARQKEILSDPDQARNLVGAFGEGNPNAEPTGADIVVLQKGPAERAGHTAVLIGRKLLIYGGSQNVRPHYYNDFFELDTDPPPKVIVSDSSSVQLFQASLTKFMNDRTFSDVTFIVQGRVVYAHKLVLCLMSERFRGMFNSGFREVNESEIVINDTSYEVFMLMMEYLYTGVPPDLVLISGRPLRLLEGKNAAGILDAKNPEEDDYDISDESDSDLEDITSNYSDEMRAVNNKGPLVNAQVRALADMQIHENNLGLIAELMEVSDKYMLDHLKHACEMFLHKAVNLDTVDALLLEAERCNATQLQSFCKHYKRNYSANSDVNVEE